MSLSVIAFVRQMLDAGMTIEHALIAGEAHEKAEQSRLEVRREHDRDRQKRQRERNVSHVTSRESQLVTPHARVRDKPSSLPLPGKKEPNGSSARVRATKRVPDDWLPGPTTLSVADGVGLSATEIEGELAKFRDYEFKTAHTDWDAAFRNWVRRAAENRPARSASPSGAKSPEQLWPFLSPSNPYRGPKQEPDYAALRRKLDAEVAANGSARFVAGGGD